MPSERQQARRIALIVLGLLLMGGVLAVLGLGYGTPSPVLLAVAGASFAGAVLGLCGQPSTKSTHRADQDTQGEASGRERT
ncbi:hypothetical protein [Saccharothrix obliqua]|uniref:hypothetical protein n=1 Tax=Saccharothrix obliqua TaxID=2861747 RepID=UPI001C5EDE52|nr:hypothetical protein [Saccharothrix obliqua]MBW4722435.1 hypothetical protein [Saccharothrix obliqua]